MTRLITLLFILISTELSQAKQVINIVIEGTPSSKIEFYKQKITPLVQKDFTLKDIQKAVEALYKTETVDSVEVYEDNGGDKSNIIFKIRIRQIINTIKVSGNSSFSRLEIINELGVNEGEGISEERIKVGLERIKRMYNLSGFLNATVGADFLQQESYEVVLFVQIQEGPACVIENVEFLSVNSKLNNDLKNTVKKKIKKVLSQSILSEIQTEINEYLANEKYYSTNVIAEDPFLNSSRTQARLTFTITDPYYYSLFFEGNEQYTEAQIIKELNIDQNNRLTSSPVDDLKERIIKFYKKRGYANISIKHQERIISQEFIRRINFTINEGPRVRIKSINFEGVYSRKENYYSNFIEDHSGDLISKGFYNSDDLDTGVKNLTTELQNQGYIAAQIPSTRIDFDKNRETVSIKIVLNEGPQTFLDKVIFKGADKITSQELEAVIGLKSGGPLQLSQLAEAATRITEHYHSFGYLDAKVLNPGKNIIQYFDENKKANLTFEIFEGPKIIVNGIVVEGNYFTKEHVIKRELQFQDGEILTPEKISYSEVKLQRLALFNSIEIRTLMDDPLDGNRVVLVIVSERTPGVLTTGIGANNEITPTITAFAGATYRNLFGTGRGVNFRVDVNEKFGSDKLRQAFLEEEVSFGYSEPYIFNTKNNIKFTITQYDKLNSIDTTQSPTRVFADNLLQADLILERDLTRNIKLYFTLYGFAHTNTYEIYDQVAPTPLNIATIGPTLTYDLRDDVFYPTRGSFSSVSFEYSSPKVGSTATVNYGKTVGSFSKYFSFGPFVFAQQFSAGHIRNFGENDGGVIPRIKAFILGGRSTIRGFDSGETIPRITEDVIKNGIAQAYNIFYLAKSEIRFPISGGFAGTLFYDGGRFEVPNYTQRFPWRDSVGLGLRYITPVGPVSLEYGQKLNKDTSRGEGDFAVHFSIGVF